jgi:hypothetical protein
MSVPTLLTSKKFQAAVVAVLCGILVELIPALRDVPLEAVLTPFVAYILAQGLADFSKERPASPIFNFPAAIEPLPEKEDELPY